MYYFIFIMQNITEICEILDNMYVHTSLRCDTLELNAFSFKIRPFIHMIDYWASVIGLLLSKCANFNHRRAIIKNLSDENCSDVTHVESFYRFLFQSSGLEVMESMMDIMENTKDNPIVARYKKSIIQFVETHSFDDCCQMLGSVEYTYLLVSNDIGKLFLKSTGKNITAHYNIKDTYNRQHATNFFDCNSKKFKFENVQFGFNWIVSSMNELLCS